MNGCMCSAGTRWTCCFSFPSNSCFGGIRWCGLLEKSCDCFMNMRPMKVFLNEVGRLQTQFGISIEAILHRLKDEHIMSDALHTQFYIKQNMSPKLKAWAKTSTYLGEETSYRFSRMVYRALAENLISEEKANEILGTNEISYIDNK